MFEFAIQQHQKHKPSPRRIAAFATSCAIHVMLLLVLIEYPQLLDTGISRWFRAQMRVYPAPAKEWRPVAILSSNEAMELPPAEVLSKVIYDWEAAKGEGKQPPIRVSWSAQQLAALREREEAAPPSKPVPGMEEPKPVPPDVAAADPAAAPEVTPGSEAGKGKAGLVYLPPPRPPAPPKAIPEKAAEVPSLPAPEEPAPKKESPAAAARKSDAQVFSDRQAAIRSQESGLFDTKGFPMGDYATLVIEKVRSNWSIPSNLRNSQGSTTIVFYIHKDGHFMDARIVVPSGSNSLDLAALSAIIGSNPFPPLPTGFPADRVGAKFVFSYNERP